MPIFACIRKELNSVMSVILFPGIKCHDVSSFTCLTCTLVFFVPIPGFTSHPSHCVRVCVSCLSLCVCRSLPSLSNATHPPISASAQTMSTVSVYVSTQTFLSFFLIIIIYFWLCCCCFVPSPSSRHTENVVCPYRSPRCILFAMCGE